MIHFRLLWTLLLFANIQLPLQEARAQNPDSAENANAQTAKSPGALSPAASRSREIFKVAFELYKEGQWEAAELQFKKGLELDPNALAYYYLAETQTRLHKTEEAKQNYATVIRLAPDSKEGALASVFLKRESKREAEQPIPGSVFRDCPDCPEMVVISSGKFQMGSNNGNSDEKPVHSVRVHSFALGKTEITQGQWRAMMGNNPSHFNSCGDDCPVEQVSWDDAQAFIQKLNAKTGKQYRLPSEAEWEYACRAGGQHEYCGSDNLDSIAWYGENTNGSTYPVGRKQPNAFGLYDMSGNVIEWAEDISYQHYNGAPEDGSARQGNGAYRALRGGPWLYFSPQSFRAANRFRDVPMRRNNIIGFRVARMLP